MSSFNLAIPATLKNEGGAYITMDLDDPGGATKYGISLRFYKAAIKESADVNTIRELSLADAMNIYDNHFWKPNNYGQITTQSIAAKIFDIGVNIGPAESNKIAQRALGTFYGHTGVDVDGVMGNITISKINHGSVDRQSYLTALKEGYACYYRELV